MTTTLKLTVPSGRSYPDGFYEQVAARWTLVHIIWGKNHPAKHLAEANDLPVSTVHRWVREARRRGILGPGQNSPGKACHSCGQPMDARAIAHDQRRRANWQ